MCLLATQSVGGHWLVTAPLLTPACPCCFAMKIISDRYANAGIMAISVPLQTSKSTSQHMLPSVRLSIRSHRHKTWLLCGLVPTLMAESARSLSITGVWMFNRNWWPIWARYTSQPVHHVQMLVGICQRLWLFQGQVKGVCGTYTAMPAPRSLVFQSPLIARGDSCWMTFAYDMVLWSVCAHTYMHIDLCLIIVRTKT